MRIPKTIHVWRQPIQTKSDVASRGMLTFVIPVPRLATAMTRSALTNEPARDDHVDQTVHQCVANHDNAAAQEEKLPEL